MRQPHSQSAANAATFIALALSAMVASPALAQSTEYAPGRPYFSAQEKFVPTSGVAIYETICQGCHMPQGKGAVGAGSYPALAADANLASANYVTYMVLNGRKAMPPFANALDDAQVAQVVNYVRSNFGNAYSDTVSPVDVKTARPAASPGAGAR